MFLAKRPTTRSRKAKSRPSQPIALGPFPLGVNTVLGANELQDGEMSRCVNWKISPMGGLEIRPGLTRYTASALTNAASHIAYFPIAGTIAGFAVFTDTADVEWTDTSDVEWKDDQPGGISSDELIVTYPDNKLYYLDSTKTPVLITTLEGEATLVPFGTYTLVLDGGQIKLWDRTTATLFMAYDDGTGTNGYQVDNTGLTADTTIQLNSGGITKAGNKFTTQAWDTGYTITCTQVDAVCKSSGSPTGNIGCELYNSAGTLQATSTTTIDSSTLTGTAEELNFVFAAGAMSPETEYWAVITYSGGDGSNYVLLDCDTVASGGKIKTFTSPTWSSVTTKTGLVAIKPGRPPVIPIIRVMCGIQMSLPLLIGLRQMAGDMWAL
jgi:hypothetical protein